MAGRKPRPTGLKELLGNPGHRPPNQREPDPQGAVICPRFLKARQRRLWNQYAPVLINCGVLKASDVHMFAVWCCLAAELEESPERMTASRIAQMRALASSFGMDPSSRGRIVVQEPQSEEISRAEKYFSDLGGKAKGPIN